MASSIHKIDVDPETATITAGNKILSVDIDFVPGEFAPGGGGIVRLYFSFTSAAAADYEITVSKLGQADLTGFPLKLNSDQNFVLKSDGYYRFDIGVEETDKINFSSSVDLTKINELEIHKIVIGA